jgi:hypothetical protein
MIYDRIDVKELIAVNGFSLPIEILRRRIIETQLRRPMEGSVREMYGLLKRLCELGHPLTIEFLTSQAVFHRPKYIDTRKFYTIRADASYYALYHCVYACRCVKIDYPIQQDSISFFRDYGCPHKTLYDALIRDPRCIEMSLMDADIRHCSWRDMEGSSLTIDANSTNIVPYRKEITAYALGCAGNKKYYDMDYFHCNNYSAYWEFLLGAWSAWRWNHERELLDFLASEILSGYGRWEYLIACRYLYPSWARFEFDERDKQRLKRWKWCFYPVEASKPSLPSRALTDSGDSIRNSMSPAERILCALQQHLLCVEGRQMAAKYLRGEDSPQDFHNFLWCIIGAPIFLESWYWNYDDEEGCLSMRDE